VIVVDTQIVVYRLFPGPTSLPVEAIFEKDLDWRAPPIWLSEFRNVAAGFIRSETASLGEVLDKVVAATLMVSTEFVESERVLSLVPTSPCTAYDLEFVALAQQLQVPLVTNDRQILRSFPAVAVTPADFVQS
jgi:predicted nucleic acid-binding protein